MSVIDKNTSPRPSRETAPMSKLKLRDWSQIAEISASVGVIISLIFVAVSIERNNSLMSAETSDFTYVSLRSATELVLQDRELLMLTRMERKDLQKLDGANLALYQEWVTIYLDEWERLYSRERDGVIKSENLEAWNEYFRLWFVKHVTREMWNNLRWRITTDGFREVLDAAMDDSERSLLDGTS